MASEQTTKLLSNLTQSGLSRQNPSLYDTVRQMILQIDGLSADVLEVKSYLVTPSTAPIADVTNFTYSFTLYNIILAWTSLSVGYIYELREGTDWNTANYVTTVLGNTVPLDPRVVGTYNFLIKAIDSSGHYSENATPLSLTIRAIDAFGVRCYNESNNILFYWTPPSSVFYIDHYLVYKNGVEIGKVSATFFTYFESLGGTYQYKIRAVDIADNMSPDIISVTIVIPNPPDYQLLDTQEDDFSGTKTNLVVHSGVMSGPVDTTITYHNHFGGGTETWADQVAAGYPRYNQPTENTAEYIQVFDFGSIIDGVAVSIDYAYTNIYGTVTLACEIEVSTDGITYDTPVVGTSRFADSVRYVRVTLTFTPTDTTHDFMQMTKLTCSLGITLTMDSGEASLVSTDADGTTITFTKPFKQVNSITVTPSTTAACYTTVNFDFTTVDPTEFKAKAFDSGGNRMDVDATWKARGIV